MVEFEKLVPPALEASPPDSLDESTKIIDIYIYIHTYIHIHIRIHIHIHIHIHTHDVQCYKDT